VAGCGVQKVRLTANPCAALRDTKIALFWTGHYIEDTVFDFYRSHLKYRILVQGRGGSEFQTGGILRYFEDLKRGTNKEIGQKGAF
jgi:hypothetical protein